MIGSAKDKYVLKNELIDLMTQISYIQYNTKKSISEKNETMSDQFKSSTAAGSTED